MLRRILHLNASEHPGAARVIQQLRETFPFATAPRHLGKATPTARLVERRPDEEASVVDGSPPAT